MPSTKVVIIGAGYGGVTVAQRLRHARTNTPLEIHLVDKKKTFVDTCRLGEVLSGQKTPGRVASPLTRLARGAGIHQGQVLGIEADSRTLTIAKNNIEEHEKLTYDHLIVALGSITDDRSIPGIQQHAFSFRSPKDAVQLQKRLTENLTKAAKDTDPLTRKALCHMVVIGGSFAGIQAAGNAHSFLRRLTAKQFPALADEIHVTLIEQKPRLLTALPDEVGAATTENLEKCGVELLTSHAVIKITEDAAHLKSGEILPSSCIVWAGGKRAPLFIEEQFPGEKTTGGRLVTDPMLAVRGTENIWACGDSASVPYLDHGGDCPQSAAFAVGQGKRLATNLLSVLREDYPRSFRLSTTAFLIPTGKKTAGGTAFGHTTNGAAAATLAMPTRLFTRPFIGPVASLSQRFRPIEDTEISTILSLSPPSSKPTSVTIGRKPLQDQPLQGQ